MATKTRKWLGLATMTWQFEAAVTDTESHQVAKDQADDLMAEIVRFRPTRHDRNLNMDVPRLFNVRPVELSIEKGLVFVDTDGEPEGLAAIKPLEKVSFSE